MDDIQSQVLACFQAAFPGIDASALLQLRQADTPQWDSMASVNLVRLLEEQFQIEFDLFDMENLDSFAAIEAHVRTLVAARS